MTTAFTKNFALSLPDFRAGPWHDLINNDLIKLDALLFGALSQVDTLPWTNLFHYEPGVTVTDSADASTWMSNVDHTSAAAGTFAADRTAHPTYWVRLLTGFAPRGEWAHNTHYFPYDLAYQTSQGVFALCTIEHVSNAVGTIITDAANWSFLVDFHAIGLSTASVVTYNPAGTALVSTNVQNAINELAAKAASLLTTNNNQNTDIGNLQAKDVVHEARMTTIESVNTSQASNLASLNSFAAGIPYAPVNRAGDIMTGNLNLRGAAGLKVIWSTGSGASKGAVATADGAYWYLIPSDQNGVITAMRPIIVDLTTGEITLGGTGEVVWTGANLGVGGTLTVNGGSFINGYTTINDILHARFQIGSDIGYDCKAGQSGGFTGHFFNFAWDGTQLQAYVDNTTTGVVCDPRVKQEIRPLEDKALDRLFMLQTVSFRYRNISIYRDDGKRHLGFLADNLAAYIPEAVKGELDGYCGDDIAPVHIDTTAIIATLVRAVQELTLKVTTLENRSV